MATFSTYDCRTLSLRVDRGLSNSFVEWQWLSDSSVGSFPLSDLISHCDIVLLLLVVRSYKCYRLTVCADKEFIFNFDLIFEFSCCRHLSYSIKEETR